VYKADDPPAQYSGVEGKDPFDKETKVKPNDVTAAIYLLIRTQDITSEVFNCPSTDAVKMNYGDKKFDEFSNFKSEENLSFSFANPYPGNKAIEAGYRMDVTLGAEFAIAADMNPGRAAGADVTPKDGPADDKAQKDRLRKANSLNHRGDGQNVLYGDGHVEFMATPFAGVKADNIYTVAGAADGSKTTSETISGSPAGADDSVLLPVATASPHKRAPEEMERALLAEFRKMQPEMRRQLRQLEAEEGASSERVRQLKAMLDAMEKEAAEIEAKQK
jgi:prepilin-type processing-associated H-X9-DG protein